ncbi:MAG: response regulator [Desulfuromonadales bacterium]
MGRKRILVSHDDELLSALNGAFFFAGGVDLLVAESGPEAFRLIEEEDPDLVFLSPRMDGLSGIECCEKVKNDPILKITPLIALLPAEKEDSLTDSCREHFDDILVKPIDHQKVLSLTCRYLGICERPNRRVLTQLPAHFRYKGRKRHGLTQDISLGGVFVETRHLVPVGNVLDLEIEFPGRKEMVVFPVKVAWVNHPEWIKKDDFPCGMGMGFVEMSAQARQALEEFLAQSNG